MMRFSEAKLGMLSLSGFEPPRPRETKKFVNVTPHDVHLIHANETMVTVVPRSGIVARLETKTDVIGAIGEFPLHRTDRAGLVDLPPPVPGTVYIASLLVVEAARRDDVVSPDDMVRDEQGRILGCRALATYSS